MKKWQRTWFYFVIGYAILHLIRDILQDLGIKMWLSTILVKRPLNNYSSIVFHPINTYFIEVLEIIFAFYCLKKKQFGKIGLTTIFIAILTLIWWLIYWFLI